MSINELKKLPNWVGYLLPNKIPIDPKTGKAASSSDRSTWGSYEQAIQSIEKWNTHGVGFMFEAPYIGIDMDDAVVDGVLSDFAKSVVLKCNSYTEYSPSRTGLHIICKGKLDRGIKTKAIEVYQTGRFFTVTQKPLMPVKPIRELTFDVAELVPNREDLHKPFVERIKTIQNGTRNNDFTSLAGSLRARGYKPEEIFELLRPKAAELHFDERELQLICGSVGRYAVPNVDVTGASSIDQFLSEIQKVEWICEGLIAKQSLGFIAGLPETNKTWMMIDLAIECAKENGLWLGKFPVKQTKVLYVDQERFKGETQRRFKAVLSNSRASLKSVKDALFVKSGTTTRLNLEHSFAAFKKELSDLKPGLVIVDSWATIHTAEENNRQSIQEVLEKIKELRNEFGCTFLFISHENKMAFNREDNPEPSIAQMSGNIAIPAAAELVLTVRKSDPESSMVYNTKNTLASTQAPFMVKVTDIDEAKSKIEVRAY